MSLFYAPFPLLISWSIKENPVKPSFSVRMENKPFNHSDCQNSQEMHLIYGSLIVLKLRQNRTCVLACPDPETLLEREYEGHFFLKRYKKDSTLEM